jgi:hypothetical protein
MGAWGAGLYANDLAADLKSTIAALAKLPFDGDRIAEILCQDAAEVIADEADEDYTNFWLVAADQFQKKGLRCESVRKTAIRIIESGQDIALMTDLDMSSTDLKHRQKCLAELKARLSAPVSSEKPRKTMKKPQPLVMSVGELFAYPVSQGEPLNPYFPHPRTDVSGWKHDGFGAMLIIDTGLAFGFLAWYTLATIDVMTEQPLRIDEALNVRKWFLRNSGTSSVAHMKKMELAKIASCDLDHDKIAKNFPNRKAGVSYAVNDITICNHMSIAPTNAQVSIRFSSADMVEDKYVRVMYPSINSLSDILVPK